MDSEYDNENRKSALSHIGDVGSCPQAPPCPGLFCSPSSLSLQEVGKKKNQYFYILCHLEDLSMSLGSVNQGQSLTDP